jgi:hypothetical protein
MSVHPYYTSHQNLLHPIGHFLDTSITNNNVITVCCTTLMLANVVFDQPSTPHTIPTMSDTHYRLSSTCIPSALLRYGQVIHGECIFDYTLSLAIQKVITHLCLMGLPRRADSKPHLFFSFDPLEVQSHMFVMSTWP